MAEGLLMAARNQCNYGTVELRAGRQLEVVRLEVL